MSIFNEINTTKLEGEEILYESKYGISIENGMPKPVYLVITNKRLLTFKDEALSNPMTYILATFIPFSRLWLKKNWVAKETFLVEELKGLERYKNGFNDTFIKFNKSNGSSLIIGLGDNPSFERLFSFIDKMFDGTGKCLQQTEQRTWNVI